MWEIRPILFLILHMKPWLTIYLLTDKNSQNWLIPSAERFKNNPLEMSVSSLEHVDSTWQILAVMVIFGELTFIFLRSKLDVFIFNTFANWFKLGCSWLSRHHRLSLYLTLSSTCFLHLFPLTIRTLVGFPFQIYAKGNIIIIIMNIFKISLKTIEKCLRFHWVMWCLFSFQ